MSDLEYITSGMFTCFIPNTPAGENAWRVMAEKLNGNATILSIYREATLKQLRMAGYSVRKAKSVKKIHTAEIDALLSKLSQ